MYLLYCVIFGYSYNIVHYLYYNVPVPAGERCVALSTNKWYQQLAHQILIGLLLNTRSNARDESWLIEQRTIVPVYSSDIGSDNRGGTALAGQCPQYGKIKKCGRTYCSWRLRIQHISARSVKGLLSIGYRRGHGRGYGWHDTLQME